MLPYLLYTDAAVDLPQHVYEEYDIRIIPMSYMLNGKSILFDSSDPGRDALCEELYRLQREGADVHTSQINMFTYMDAWEPMLAEGNDVLYISFSSGMSATYDNAVGAAQSLMEKYPDRRIIVVDSKAATAGQGLLTTCAAKAREEGKNIEENAEYLRGLIPNLCHRFVVGDLDYLHKGGRVSAAVAIVGGMLNIKPLLIIDDEGKLETVGKARGMKAAMKSLIRSYVNEMGVPGTPKLIYLGHTCHYDQIKEFEQAVREAAEPGTIVESIPLTPIIGVHIGPSFFSLCGFGKHRKEEK